jgi:WhiB family redox-sensing transcriptional regulator
MPDRGAHDPIMTERRFRHRADDTWWIPGARCVGEDPELFFPVGSSEGALEQTEHARAICLDCAVRPECLEWALATCQDAGVWGGLDEEQRREIRRARRTAVAAVATADDDQLAAVG